MKNKLFLVVAPVIAVLYLSFISYPTMVSLLKMLALHKGDPEISDGVRYFVTLQHSLMAFFPPVVIIIAFIRNLMKIKKNTPPASSTNRKASGDNPYAPPAAEPSAKLLKDLPRDERKKLILAGKTTAGPLVVFMHKNLVGFAIMGIAAISAFFVGCWTYVQM